MFVIVTSLLGDYSNGLYFNRDIGLLKNLREGFQHQKNWVGKGWSHGKE